MKTLFNTKIALMLALGLGLAPFVPEPHIWGKLKWIVGGANGMKLMDWGDVVLHGLPWIWLVITVLYHLLHKRNRG